MKAITIIFTVAFINLSFNLSASLNGTVTGRVLDQKQQPLGFFTVTLLAAKDSSLVKGQFTDASGNFIFENIDAGNYLVAVNGVGYQLTHSFIFTLNAHDEKYKLPTLVITEEVETLKQVVVKAQKPFITQQLDKMVMNVENSVVNSSGLTALELLEKAPGVQVDNDGILSLRGKDKVLVMINGKPNYLTSSALTAMLQSMQAETIKEIEIISNPSAKYEAEGNAGIINIRMKKSKNDGFNGNATASLGYGMYWKENAGVSLNFREGNMNLFGNYNFSDGEYMMEYKGINRFFENGNLRNSQDFYGFRLTPRTTHTIRTGMDYSLGQNTTIGLLFNGRKSSSQNQGRNEIGILDGENELLFTSFSNNLLTNEWSKWSGNLNLIHQFGKIR